MPAIAAVIVGTFLIFAAYRAGTDAGNALWLPVVLALIGALLLGMHLWHKRWLHRIHELYSVEVGNFYRLSMFSDWPKYCGKCGVTVHSWKQVRAHDNEISSPCMRLRIYLESRDKQESLPMAGFTAEVLRQPDPEPPEPWRPEVAPPGDHDRPAGKLEA